MVHKAEDIAVGRVVGDTVGTGRQVEVVVRPGLTVFHNKHNALRSKIPCNKDNMAYFKPQNIDRLINYAIYGFF